jgi:hypothetical protein
VSFCDWCRVYKKRKKTSKWCSLKKGRIKTQRQKHTNFQTILVLFLVIISPADRFDCWRQRNQTEIHG